MVQGTSGFQMSFLARSKKKNCTNCIHIQLLEIFSKNRSFDIDLVSLVTTPSFNHWLLQ